MNEQCYDPHEPGIPAICRSCEARHKGVCGALTTDQLGLLAKNNQRRVWEAGDVLIHDAEPIHFHANILKGVVKLTKVLAEGQQQIVGLQFAPDFLGRPLSAESKLTAAAASKVTLCSFPKSIVDRLAQVSPGFEHRLLSQTLKELDEAREWMVTLGRKTAKEKIASLLSLIATHIDPEPEDEVARFCLPLSRADIADFLGLTTETVSRQMTLLRQAGVIGIEQHRKITVPDMKRLREEAGF